MHSMRHGTAPGRVPVRERILLALAAASALLMEPQQVEGQFLFTSGKFDRSLDVNRIWMALSRNGNLARSQASYQASAWYESSAGIYNPDEIVFDAGLWVTGLLNGRVGVLPTLWRSPFSPGPIIGGQPALTAHPEDSLRYRVYRVTIGDTPSENTDMSEWPNDLGAPIDGSGQPAVSADQTLWCVYNGLDSTRVPVWFRRNLGPMPQMPVEIHQKAFAHYGGPGDTSVWANTLFFEWKIFNRGSVRLDSVYFSYWTDIDFLGAFYTIPAVDTARQIGYCWYGPDSTREAVGYILLYGPQVPSAGQTATAFGGLRYGQRNLPLTAFHGIVDDSTPDSAKLGPPYSVATSWNVVRGLTPAGTPILDTLTGRTTTFPWSGDPLTHQGMLFPYRWTGGGGGFMITSGPVTMSPGDSQWVMIALLATARVNGTDAITLMRQEAATLRSLPYDSLIARKPRRPGGEWPLRGFDLPTGYDLLPPYPNPFNAGTTVPFVLPHDCRVIITAYDILGRQVGVLTDGLYQQGARSVRWNPTLASGLYIIRVKADPLDTRHGGFSGSRSVLLVR